MTSALERLADRCGIEREAVDWHGNVRRVPDDTLRRLLHAMGIDAHDDAAAEAANAALDDERWSEPIDTVQVVRCDEPFSIDVRLPAGTARVEWLVQLETGEEHSGDARFGDLERTAVHGAAECRRLPLNGLPAGYHTLSVATSGGYMTLIATPAACWLPDGGRNRYWGLSAQLYLVRSARNWGIGDFTDLRELVAVARAHGAQAVGVNPLHALFADNPEHASPYSPSSRLLTNVLNIDVDAVPELASSAAARALLAKADVQAKLEDCRHASHVRYRTVAELKGAVLDLLFDEASAARGERWRRFEQFLRDRGPLFERHCLFLALRAHFAAQDPERADWRRWPRAFQDCRSPEVAQFARSHELEVQRVAWLQWLADEQLGAAAADARELAIGLYADLAVGADPAGAETWSEPGLTANGAHIGAPPDPMSEHGQDWGLPPVDPRVLRARAYRSFVELLRANMRHAGALRIDHAMALRRLYWVPEGAKPIEGAYVRYPQDDLIGILALESHRNRCMVVGEDLGTVPPGFRERMSEANILSYRVLMFERDESQRFIPPAQYPRLALAVAGNHDLPTLRGWWEARDIGLEAEYRSVPDEEAARRRSAREREKAALLETLRAEGLLPHDGEPTLDDVVIAAHALLALTPAILALAQLDDVALELDPVNVPSLSKYPNWRRRLDLPLEALAAEPRLRAIAAAFHAERGAPASS